jgi:hypothetical protein
MTNYKCKHCRDTGKFYVVTAGGDEVLCDCCCTRNGIEHLPLEAQDRIITLRQELDRIKNDYAEWMSHEDYVPMAQKVEAQAATIAALRADLAAALKREAGLRGALETWDSWADPVKQNAGVAPLEMPWKNGRAALAAPRVEEPRCNCQADEYSTDHLMSCPVENGEPQP